MELYCKNINSLYSMTLCLLAYFQGIIKCILFKTHGQLASNTERHQDMHLALISDISLFKEGYFVCRMQRAEN